LERTEQQQLQHLRAYNQRHHRQQSSRHLIHLR
jgi:hypothetical protein